MTVDAVRSALPGGPAVPSVAGRRVLEPLGHRAVTLDRLGWLGSWQDRTVRATLPHVLGRVWDGEARANLARLRDPSAGPLAGMVFTDSDVHKTLEAVAWAADRLDPDGEVLRRAGELVALLAAVQDPDGYLVMVAEHIGERPLAATG